MRVIVAGSRTFTTADYPLVKEVCLSSGYWFTSIISGTAHGVDLLGEMFAKEIRVPVERFPADWTRFGKSAGYKRNEQMAKVADALVLVWDGKSLGSKHMLDIARAKRLIVYVRIAQPEVVVPLHPHPLSREDE